MNKPFNKLFALVVCFVSFGATAAFADSNNESISLSDKGSPTALADADKVNAFKSDIKLWRKYHELRKSLAEAASLVGDVRRYTQSPNIEHHQKVIAPKLDELEIQLTAFCKDVDSLPDEEFAGRKEESVSLMKNIELLKPELASFDRGNSKQQRENLQARLMGMVYNPLTDLNYAFLRTQDWYEQQLPKKLNDLEFKLVQESDGASGSSLQALREEARLLQRYDDSDIRELVASANRLEVLSRTPDLCDTCLYIEMYWRWSHEYHIPRADVDKGISDLKEQLEKTREGLSKLEDLTPEQYSKLSEGTKILVDTFVAHKSDLQELFTDLDKLAIKAPRSSAMRMHNELITIVFFPDGEIMGRLSNDFHERLDQLKQLH